MIIKLFDEQLRDAAHMDLGGLGEAGDAGPGQRDHDATPVSVGTVPPHETVVN